VAHPCSDGAAGSVLEIGHKDGQNLFAVCIIPLR
jgi:hypothetical protein